VISLANILQDFTKKLKELIGKEQLLENRIKKAQPRIEILQQEHDAKLVENFEAEKKKLYEKIDKRIELSSQVAKLAEIFENEKKVFSQALYAMYRTENVTDLLPRIDSPIDTQKDDGNVTVSWLTIAAWILSLLLSNGNVVLHGYLVVHAIVSQVKVKDDTLFFSGIAMYLVVCLLKMVPTWMYAFNFLGREKPKFLRLMENLSALLPVSTQIMHKGTDYVLPEKFEVAGIIISIAEVVISTYMSKVDSKSIQALVHSAQKGAFEVNDSAAQP